MIELFITFFKLGLFTFGGGYAMIPLIKEAIINQKGWMTDDEVLEMIAIAESTPGPIAINMATYVGYRQKGLLGSIFSTLGVILPSLIIIYVISLFFDAFMQNIYIQYAFTGIKCGVAVLITKTGIEMLVKCKKNIINIVLFALAFITMIVVDLCSISMSAILLILIGGVAGIVAYTVSYKLVKNVGVANAVIEDIDTPVVKADSEENVTNETVVEDTTTNKDTDTKKPKTDSKKSASKSTTRKPKTTGKKTTSKTQDKEVR